MADEINVRARLTADDQASAVIRRLQSQLKRLERQINTKFSKAKPLTDNIVDPKIVKYLEKTGGAMGKLTPSYVRNARRMREANQLTQAGWDDLIGKIRKYEQVYNSAGRKATKLSAAQRKDMRDLVRQAHAYQYVWNQAYGQMQNIHGRMTEAQRKTDKRAQRDRFKDIRYLARLRENYRKSGDRADARKYFLERYRARVRERSERIEQRRQKHDFNQQLGNTRYLSRVRQATERHEQRARDEQYRHTHRMRRSAMQNLGQAAHTPGRMMNRLDGNFFNSPAFYGMMAGGLAAAGVRSSVSEAIGLDRAETFGRMHMDQSIINMDSVREDWSMAMGAYLGEKAEVLTHTMVEAAKAGVPDDLSQASSELVTQVAKVFGISTGEVMNAFGFAVAQEMGAGRMQGSVADVDRLLNITSYLASTSAARPDQVFSAMRTGLGSGAMLGMDQAHTMAFLTSVVEAGAQGQQASRFLSSGARRLNAFGTNHRRIRRKSFSQRDENDKLFLQLPRLLGFGNVRGMMDSKREDPNDFIFKVFDGLSKMEDQEMKNQAAFLLFGQDFARFYNNVIESPGIWRRNIKNAVFAAGETSGDNFNSRSFAEYKQGYEHMVDSIGSIWSSVKAEVGTAFKPVMKEISEVANDWLKAVGTSGVRQRVEALIRGFVAGFGFESIRDMIRSFGMLGHVDPEMNTKFFQFAKGFAEGLKFVFETVAEMFSYVGWAASLLGMDDSPETMGKIIASILGFSVALHLLRPGVAILGLVGTMLMGLLNVGIGIYKLAKLMGLVGLAKGGLSAAAVATGGGIASLLGRIGLGALLGVGGFMTGGILIAGLVGLAALAVEIINWKAMGDWWKGTTLGRFLAAPNSPEIEAQREKYRKMREEVRNGKTGMDYLLEYFGYGNDADLPAEGATPNSILAPGYLRSLEGLSESFDAFASKMDLAMLPMGDRLSLPGYNGSYSGYGTGATGGSSGGASPSGGSSFSRQQLQSMASGPMRGFLDFIGAAEGTDRGRGYNETLGYGRFTGGPVDLTSMTLDEVDALQTRMLRHPENHFNSSAAGRYQIVQRTLRSLRSQLGLSGSERFDERMQDMLATRLAMGRGANAAGLMNEWEGLRRYSPGEILQRFNSGQSGSGSTGDAVDLASQLMGQHERRNNGSINSFLRQGGVDINAAYTAWCAGFVNSALAQVGVTGTGSLVANSFRRWGDAVNPENVLKGDVLVQHRNKGMGTGGHVGFATGNTRMGANGQLQLEMLSGNSSDQVRRTWHSANSLDVRRAVGQVPVTAESAIANVPLPPTRPAGNLGAAGASGSASASSGGPSVVVHINGANQSPDELANVLQRRLSERWAWRHHDVEHDLT